MYGRYRGDVGLSSTAYTLQPVATAAALASGSTTRPPPSQPWARALPLLLGSGPSPFAATRQPSSGRPKTEGLRTSPLTGTTAATCTLPTLASFYHTGNPNPNPNLNPNPNPKG